MQYDEKKLGELILYIVQRSHGDSKLGKTKLLKLLAYSDFAAYRRLGSSITGAVYRKLPQGPAPRQAPEVMEILEEHGELAVSSVVVGGYEQRMFRAQREPDMSIFSEREIEIVDEMIKRFRRHGNKAIADRSHQDFAGWQMVDDLEEIPYHTALLSKEEPSGHVLDRGREIMRRLASSA